MGMLTKPARPNKYAKGLKMFNNEAPPQCGCEDKVPYDNCKWGHTKPRVVSRGIGLTAYQKERLGIAPAVAAEE